MARSRLGASPAAAELIPFARDADRCEAGRRMDTTTTPAPGADRHRHPDVVCERAAHRTRRRPVRPRRPAGPAPGRRAVDRARRRHRGRVPTAAPGARRPGRPVRGGGRAGRRELPARAGPARRDRRLAGAGRRPAASRHPRPGHLARVRQGRGPARARRGHRRRHGDLRRRAVPVPAPRAGGRGQGQGDRPDRADPGHLRPARQVQGGQGPGRAGPAGVPAAATARLG